MAAPTYCAPLRRVRRGDPCPVCRHRDWCEVGDDGRVHCMRVESPVPSMRGGGWWHNLPNRREGDGVLAEAVVASMLEPPPRPPEPPRADPATCDAVYRAILDACPLSAADRAYLGSCGLPGDALGGYGTLPPRSRHHSLLARLLPQFGREALLTVPGIAEEEGSLELTLGGGLLVAVRGLEGRIDALTVRQVGRDGKKRYIWLSSAKHGGPSSGSPCHIARPAVAPTHTVLVTEGVKKADIAASRLGYTTLGLVGHGVQEAGLKTLARLAEHGALCTIIAFDEDAKPETAKLVDASRRRFAAAALALGLAVRYMRWDGALGKGIDDLLVAGQEPREESVRAVLVEDDAGDESPSSIRQEAARYRLIRRLYGTCYRDREGKDVPVMQGVDKSATVVLWEEVGYPGEQLEAPAVPLYLPKAAARMGVGRNAASAAIENLVSHGLFRREDDWTHAADGGTRRIAKFAPLRELDYGTGEKVGKSARREADRERQARRRACTACGSEDVRVQIRLVREERLTCRACGVVGDWERPEKPAKPRRYERQAAYEKHERDHEYARQVAGEEAEEAAATATAAAEVVARTPGSKGQPPPHVVQGRIPVEPGHGPDLRVIARIPGNHFAPDGAAPSTRNRPYWACAGCGGIRWSSAGGRPWFCDGCGAAAGPEPPYSRPTPPACPTDPRAPP